MTSGRRIRLIEGPVQNEWMELGSCRGSNADVFFPGKGSDVEAKRICAGCPVRVECREYGIVNNEKHGVWGGLNREDRRIERRTRRGVA